MPKPFHIAIVGAGFTGTLLAVNLLRRPDIIVTLIDRRPMFGRGTAYSATNPSHLLNVRAGNMSAFADEPRHFVEWCAARGIGDENTFVPRRSFGDYIGELLGDCIADCEGRLALACADATGVEVAGSTIKLALSNGEALQPDTVVFAIGNLPPQVPAGLDSETIGADAYVADPWAGSLVAGLQDDDTVLLLGTGLTMVDVALSLESAGFAGKMIAMSRRGLLPHRHAPGPGLAAGERRQGMPPTTVTALVRDVRARADAIGWRAAVDELRPFTQDLWGAASETERGRFLRHLRPWWDVARHRLAPEVAARIAAMQNGGKLRVLAGKPTGFQSDGTGVAVTFRPRGLVATERLTVRRIINCTGPMGDLSNVRDPLLQGLIASGLARPGHAGLGLDVDHHSRLIGADGRRHSRLYAAGPVTRGAFWEIVAVPDIRNQVGAMAADLAELSVADVLVK